VNSRRSNLTVYSDPGCPFSHQVRLVIHEKNIDADIINLDPLDWPEDVSAANPYGVGPTLLDRDLALFNSRIIMDYLDERFPHPSLMPADTVERAKLRLMLYRIDHDWYALWDALNGRERGKASKSRRSLQEDLTVLSPLFQSAAFFYE
jgi:RNA polymerase-associated protein